MLSTGYTYLLRLRWRLHRAATALRFQKACQGRRVPFTLSALLAQAERHEPPTRLLASRGLPSQVKALWLGPAADGRPRQPHQPVALRSSGAAWRSTGRDQRHRKTHMGK